MKVRRFAGQAAVVAMLVIGGAVAVADDPGPVPSQPWAASAYAQMVTRFFAGGDLQHLAAAVRTEVYEAIDLLVTDDDDVPVCAYPVGSGGNPRWDGGGSQLTPLSSAFAPWAPATANMVVQLRDLPSDLVLSKNLVIIDEFHFKRLERELASWLDEHESLRVGPGGVDDLWSVFYGQRYRGVDHGHLVAFHALAHIGPDNGENYPAITSIHSLTGERVRELVLFVEPAPGHDFIEIHLIDIALEDEASIREAFERARPYMAVVVLAWGLVDCAVRDVYGSLPAMEDDEREVSLVDYLRALLSDADTAVMVQELCRSLYGDQELTEGVTCADIQAEFATEFATIAALAEMSARASKRVFGSDALGGTPLGIATFAAAGNAGLPFPRPPAGWPGIVGVEACTKNVPELAVFSNAGAIPGFEWSVTVRNLGAWFAAPDPRLADPQLGYWGTSYAAPAAAVQYAAGRFDLADASEETLLLYGCSD